MGDDGSNWGAPPPGQQPPAQPWQQPWQHQPPPPSGWQQPPASGWQQPPGPGWQQPASAASRFRPLTLADVLDGMFRILLAHWRVYAVALGLILVPLHFVLTYLSQQMGTGAGLLEQLRNPAVTQAAIARGPEAAAIAGIGVISFLAAVFIRPFLTGVCCKVAAEAYEGADPQAGDVLRSTRARYWPLVAVTVLMGLLGIGIFVLPIGVMIAGGVSGGGEALAIGVILLLLAVLVLIWVFVRLSLAHVVVVVERAGAFEALRRSWELAAGRWWRLFGTLLLAGIVTSIVSWIAAFPFALPGTLFGAWIGVVFVTIGSVLAEIVTTPLTANARTLLYFDGRIRSEGYDLAAMTSDVAAGGYSQPYGQPPYGQPPYGQPAQMPPPQPPSDRPFG